MSRIPITILTDKNRGGAPVYIGGDRLVGETPPTPPGFVDDDDQYFKTHLSRRALMSIVHIPVAGAETVDFVSLSMRNNSSTNHAYVNIVLCADISVQARTSGIHAATPVHGDMIMVETNGTATATASLGANGALEISIVNGGNYQSGITPRVELTPPPLSGLTATASLDAAGSVQSISVLNALSHAYTSPPSVEIVGGVPREIGFYEQTDDNTIVYASSSSGSMTVLGTLARSEYANAVSSPGDVLIINGEIRVVRSIRSEAREMTIDRVLTGTESSFVEWSYIPLLSASTNSLYRIGGGTITAASANGFRTLRCSTSHKLSVGDYITYMYTTYYSHRVVSVTSATEFTVDSDIAIGVGNAVTWYYLYYLSETTPGLTALTPVQVIHFVKRSDLTGSVQSLLGMGGRQMYIRNSNFYGDNGSYYTASVDTFGHSTQFCLVSTSHTAQPEIGNSIDPSNILEIVLKPQPAPQVHVLTSYPVNGGTAQETGKRPILAAYERGSAVVSQNVTMWGHYIRYEPEVVTNYTQAVNIS